MKHSPMFLLLLGLCVSWPLAAQEFPSGAGPLTVVTVAKGLEHPWSLAFLPDGRMLVTERPGRLRIVAKDGKPGEPLKNVPNVFDEGQGGLLDVVLDPQFAKNRTIYFSFAEEENGKAGTAVAKARLGNDALSDVKVIFRQQPKVKGGNHFGSRLVFGRDGNLFVTLGERFDHAEQAQDISSHMGKVVRITPEGKAPRDNPFAGRKDALPEIWSLGHRNMQGVALNPETGQLWTAEHGPRGGDEINLDEAGKNYGWPKVSYGSHYTGIPIPDSHAEKGFTEPMHYWNPSISPSGMTFYTGNRFPKWKGHLFTGGLNGMVMTHLTMKNGRIVSEERLLKDLGERIRDVRQGPDGYLYLLTDSDDGRILRVEPKR
jgi:glucose/arabinose dehydrogenase